MQNFNNFSIEKIVQEVSDKSVEEILIMKLLILNFHNESLKLLESSRNLQ